MFPHFGHILMILLIIPDHICLYRTYHVIPHLGFHPPWLQEPAWLAQRLTGQVWTEVAWVDQRYVPHVRSKAACRREYTT